jgi:hypothetical protein
VAGLAACGSTDGPGFLASFGRTTGLAFGAQQLFVADGFDDASCSPSSGSNEIIRSVKCVCPAGYYGCFLTPKLCSPGFFCPQDTLSPIECPDGFSSLIGSTSLSSCYNSSRRMLHPSTPSFYVPPHHSFYLSAKNLLVLGSGVVLGCILFQFFLSPWLLKRALMTAQVTSSVESAR